MSESSTQLPYLLYPASFLSGADTDQAFRELPSASKDDYDSILTGAGNALEDRSNITEEITKLQKIIFNANYEGRLQPGGIFPDEEKHLSIGLYKKLIENEQDIHIKELDNNIGYVAIQPIRPKKTIRPFWP